MIFNMVGGAGGGKDGAATLTVQAPINTDVTVSKDTKSYTKNSGTTGIVTFQGLTTGEWTVSISNELQTQTRTVTITTTYSVVIAFFASTINITYPAGSTCTVKKDSITLTAPDTSGTWDCVVSSVGVWNVYCTDGELTVDQDVTITSDGETKSLNLAYFTATIAVTYPAGSTCTATDGAMMLTAPDTSGTWLITVNNTGTWTISCTDGTKSDSGTATITANGQSVSIGLSYAILLFKDGDQNPDVTGGWTQGDKWWFEGNYTVINATIGGNIICNITYPQQASARTARPIDLTKWKTLSAYLSTSRKSDATIQTKCGIAISAATSGWYGNRAATMEYASKNYTGTVSLDISNLTGSYYIYVYGGIDSCVIYANSIQLSL